MPKRGKPKPSKPVRPPTTVVHQHYKNFVKHDIAERLVHITYALHWFQEAVKFIEAVGFKNSVEHHKFDKLIQKAYRCHTTGLEAKTNNLKEETYLKSLGYYATACKCKFGNLPSLEKYVRLYKKKRLRFDVVEESMTAKFDKAIKLIQKSLGAEDITFVVVPAHKAKDRQFDPGLSRIVYSRPTMRTFVSNFYKLGLLRAIMPEIEAIAHLRALKYSEQPPGGAYEYVMYQNLLYRFCTYVSEHKLTKRLVRAVKRNDNETNSTDRR